MTPEARRDHPVAHSFGLARRERGRLAGCERGRRRTAHGVGVEDEPSRLHRRDGGRQFLRGGVAAENDADATTTRAGRPRLMWLRGEDDHRGPLPQARGAALTFMGGCPHIHT